MSEPEAIRPPSIGRDATVTTLTAFEGITGAGTDASPPHPAKGNATLTDSAAVRVERRSGRIVGTGYLRTGRKREHDARMGMHLPADGQNKPPPGGSAKACPTAQRRGTSASALALTTGRPYPPFDGVNPPSRRDQPPLSVANICRNAS